MAITAQTQPNNATTIAGPLSVVADGNLQQGNISYGGIAGQGKAANQAVATGGTILLTAGCTVLPLTAAAAATGMIMTKGTVDGQQVVLINEGGTNTITMAAAGTSFVALGTGAALAAFVKLILVWDTATQLWY